MEGLVRLYNKNYRCRRVKVVNEELIEVYIYSWKEYRIVRIQQFTPTSD